MSVHQILLLVSAIAMLVHGGVAAAAWRHEDGFEKAVLAADIALVILSCLILLSVACAHPAGMLVSYFAALITVLVSAAVFAAVAGRLLQVNSQTQEWEADQRSAAMWPVSVSLGIAGIDVLLPDIAIFLIFVTARRQLNQRLPYWPLAFLHFRCCCSEPN